jgi:hypothetical protein
LTYNDSVRFAWDEAKNRANQHKHGLSFEQASVLFRSGVEYLEIFDEEHSDAEERFLAIGPVQQGVVVICWAEQPEGTIRILSARRATRRERMLYDSYLRRKP